MKVALWNVRTKVWQATWLIATLVAAPAALAAEGLADFRILYFEAFSPSPTTPQSGNLQKSTDDALLAGIQFDAYGRRFELALEHNSKIMQDSAASGLAYRGTIGQLTGSWARLTRINEAMYGLIWDGAELYVVEPTAAAREFMVAPPNPAQTGNVIYRLSDTLVNLGPDFCSAIDSAALDPAATGLATYKTITGDLKSQLMLQRAAGATLRLTLSALGDASFLQRYSTDAEARNAIMVRLNNVDGIFSAQLGVEIAISSMSVYDTSTDPFTSATAPGNLLDELRSLRGSSSVLRAAGLTHLFTGRNLDGTTVGIAYIDALCRRSYGVGLTESRGRGSAIESLIAAHEIGHNFGAVHDGDPNGACSATPSDQFIMAPQSATGNDTFSQCSVNTMSRSLAAADCITPLPPPDAVVAFAASPTGLTLGQQFAWSVNVTNNGGQQSPDASVAIALPGALTVNDASAPGGSCTSGAGTVQCTLGPLTAGESRTVALLLTAQASGTFAVNAVATATNDANTANNTATASLAVDAAAPVANPTPAPTSAGNSGNGGGGGSMGLVALSVLGALAGVRRRRLAAA